MFRAPKRQWNQLQSNLSRIRQVFVIQTQVMGFILEPFASHVIRGFIGVATGRFVLLANKNDKRARFLCRVYLPRVCALHPFQILNVLQCLAFMFVLALHNFIPLSNSSFDRIISSNWSRNIEIASLKNTSTHLNIVHVLVCAYMRTEFS